jgi:hypothetical protein
MTLLTGKTNIKDTEQQQVASKERLQELIQQLKEQATTTFLSIVNQPSNEAAIPLLSEDATIVEQRTTTSKSTSSLAATSISSIPLQRAKINTTDTPL